MDRTYSVFDIPFIAVAGNELVHLQFLILIFLCIQRSFLGKPAHVVDARHMRMKQEREWRQLRWV